MKTTKFFAVLSLALIFAGVNTVYSDNGLTKNPKQLIKTTVRYAVNIHLPAGIDDVCNTYLVQLTDESGRPVAHPQVFVPSVKRYLFEEAATVKGTMRVASLVLVDDGNFCPITLITKPAIKTGKFLPGNTYSFDLYPIIQKNVIEGNVAIGDPDAGIEP